LWCKINSGYVGQNKEAKIAVVKVEGVTKRVIVEGGVVIGASLDLPLHICSDPPKQTHQPSLSMQNHQAWLKFKIATHDYE